jgi:hypothetical protein
MSTKANDTSADFQQTRQRLKEFMARKSYMDLEKDEDECLGYGTREAGDIEEDRAGARDVAHARAMQNNIVAAFHDVVVRLDTVDEWVQLTITKKKPK